MNLNIVYDYLDIADDYQLVMSLLLCSIILSHWIIPYILNLRVTISIQSYDFDFVKARTIIDTNSI